MNRLIITAIIIAFGAIAVWSGDRRAITETDVSKMLTTLDHELGRRDINIKRRQHEIDSLYARVNTGRLSIDDFRKIGIAAKGFDNNMAISVFDRAIRYADSINDSHALAEFRLHEAGLLPLAGFTSEAVSMFESVDTAGLSLETKRLYYDSGRRMYGYIANIYQDYPLIHAHYDSLSLRMMQTQIGLNELPPLPPLSQRLVNKGEYLYLSGRHHDARRLLLQAIDSISQTDNSYAIAAYLLASIAEDLGNENELIYYLGLSALADNRAATREVTSLQRLGKYMLDRDDVDRAHSYLYKAMQNAAEAHVATRMIQTASALPLIEEVHNRELDNSRLRIYSLIAIMAILIILLAGALVAAYHRSVYRRKLQEHLEASNLAKETYISRFLDLCAIYMDKLNQFCKVASNKIQTGQVDELYRLTRSGKFVENNSSDFYAIFDDAFLHMYPDFLEKVNGLLRDDAKITLRDGEKLNTDLRILAFMRLGIDDTARVGRILNYSVNTIYAYRNKLRNRAIDRENFEANIASL